MLIYIHILDLEMGLLPGPPSRPDQEEVQSSEQDEEIKSGTDLKGSVKRLLKTIFTNLK